MTEEQRKKVVALGYYLFHLKRVYGDSIITAIPQESDYDYHQILSQVEDRVSNGIESLRVSGVNVNNVPVEEWYYSLDEIDIEQDDYEVIARQIYDGTHWQNVAWETSEPVSDNDLAGCFGRYINSLSGGRESTRSTVETVVERMNSLFIDKNSNRVNGLIVGRVQSGKTQNFTGLALKAIGENWNMIVVLTSDNTALATQTRNRLFDSFKDSGTNVRNCKELDFLHNVAESPQIDIQENFFYWGVAMKESHSLQRIIDCLDRANQEGNVEKIRLLIIDDEADNATPNSAVGRDFLSKEEIDDYLDLLRAEEKNQIADWLGALQDFNIPEDSEEQTEEQIETDDHEE